MKAKLWIVTGAWLKNQGMVMKGRWSNIFTFIFMMNFWEAFAYSRSVLTCHSRVSFISMATIPSKCNWTRMVSTTS